VFPVYGSRGRKGLRLVETPDGDVDAVGMVFSLPADGGSARAAEGPRDPLRRRVGRGSPLQDLELTLGKEPRDRLRADRPPAIRAVTDEDLFGTSCHDVSDRAAATTPGRLSFTRGQGGFLLVGDPARIPPALRRAVRVGFTVYPESISHDSTARIADLNERPSAPAASVPAISWRSLLPPPRLGARTPRTGRGNVRVLAFMQPSSRDEAG
jgi:hypothetical protein